MPSFRIVPTDSIVHDGKEENLQNAKRNPFRWMRNRAENGEASLRTFFMIGTSLEGSILNLNQTVIRLARTLRLRAAETVGHPPSRQVSH